MDELADELAREARAARRRQDVGAAPGEARGGIGGGQALPARRERFEHLLGCDDRRLLERECLYHDNHAPPENVAASRTTRPDGRCLIVVDAVGLPSSGLTSTRMP